MIINTVMMKMIDLHTHCLPGIDDGAKNTEQSMDMLADSFRQGVELCAATPHCIIHRQNDLENFLDNRRHAMDRLLGAMEKDGRNFPKMTMAGEVYFDNDLNNYRGLERVCYTGTNYLLLEFPIERTDPKWAERIYEMNRRGINILIAHVDRYPDWENMMKEFKGLGVKYQINASRFLKFSSKKLLKSLMDKRNDYIISSDMHNMNSRKCNMADAFEKAKKKYGTDAEKMFCTNAEELLNHLT